MDQSIRVDFNAVRSLVELLKEADLTEIEYQVDTVKIKVSRRVSQTIASTVPQTTPVSDVHNTASFMEMESGALENHPGVIEAQMVGTVYLSPGSNAAPFVSLGDVVSQGQTLFIIEAMKVMNMIKAPRSGVVKHIFVKDSQPVEYGDPIIIIE